MSVKIAPSLLASDFGAFAESARQAVAGGAEYLHFDVMDGQFVPNITFGADLLRALRPAFDVVFDTHLMIVQPERFIEAFVSAGANIVTVQVEACTHVQRTLAQIRDAGAKAGLALNPATPLSVLEYVLDDIDLLLIMTVNPGFGGQEFLPAMERKIVEARTLLNRAHHPIELEVDGGIGPDNAAKVVRAGASVLVAGTSVFGHPGGPAAGVRVLRESISTGT
ncbi:MAG TPA: ribulose-phosphate 3-epimerase [Chthonomonadales bacterium]|nr:ribulose-phosphate 3-epimerase [Chthonomonadales bacterium]